MAQIAISGCSWGCGEWKNGEANTLELSHPGVTEYLSSDFSTINLSIGGGSNWQICFAIRNYLELRVDKEKAPTVFIIQTDIARSKASEKYSVDYYDILSKSNTLVEYYTNLLEIFYIKLDSMAKQYGIKIHMIGGLTDLDLELLSLYKNLIPCCASWVELLDKNHKPSIIPLILNPNLLMDAKKSNNTQLVREIIEYSDQNFLEAQHLMETDYFGPAHGDFHPSRKGHEVLANYIKHYVKEIL